MDIHESLIENPFGDMPAGIDPLFNARAPQVYLQSEKPEHVAMVYLKAQGLSNREISRRFGTRYGSEYVGTILAQPWARQRLLSLLHETGQPEVDSLLKSAMEDSVYRLIEERDNKKARPSERISAANALLDRYFGKPTQRVMNDNVTYSLDDIKAMEREEREIDEELRRTGGTAN